MSEQKQVLNELTSLIYQELFGMSRDEMLIECKKHVPGGWINLWDSEDENMRDYLSIDALGCLAGAEKAVMDFVNHHGQSLARTFYISYLPRIIKPYKIEDLIIWEDES